jgi:hypothetical protein
MVTNQIFENGTNKFLMLRKHIWKNELPGYQCQKNLKIGCKLIEKTEKFQPSSIVFFPKGSQIDLSKSGKNIFF